MAQLTRLALHGEIDGRFPDNTTELITPPVVRAFLHNLVDSALLAASDKVSLSKTLALAEAHDALDNAEVEPGQYYAITGNWNFTGRSTTVYVHGTSPDAFEPVGVQYASGTYTQVLVDVAAGTTTRQLKADLVNGRVPDYQLPARAVGNVDYRNRLRANTGTITILGGSYWHVAGEVTLDLRNLAQEDIFFLRISSFASASVWTRLLATDGKVIGAYPQGTALLFRRSGAEPADLAVITVSSEYPSYAGAFVPLAIEDAVANGDWDASNRLTTAPSGSVATMQFFDENYLYFCFLEAQVQNGVLTYAWFRVPRTGSGGGGGGSYVLPAATATRRGGIKIGAGLAVDVDGVASLALAPYTTLEYAASLALDFAQPAQLLTLAGNLTISGTLNRMQGRELTLHLRNPAGSAAVLNWPAWKWRGAIPTSLPAGQEATLSLVGAWGAAESDIVAGFIAQP